MVAGVTGGLKMTSSRSLVSTVSVRVLTDPGLVVVGGLDHSEPMEWVTG